jgi:hypothetical protein
MRMALDARYFRDAVRSKRDAAVESYEETSHPQMRGTGRGGLL